MSFPFHYTVNAYDANGVLQEQLVDARNWQATEMCCDYVYTWDFAYSEIIDCLGQHHGEYGVRPASLGERKFTPSPVGVF